MVECWIIIGIIFMIKKYLFSKKKIIVEEILSFLADQEQGSLALDYDTLSFLKSFVTSGKLYRGGLVFLGYDLFASKLSENLEETHPDKILLKKMALVLELTHSALLLHDDVMDQDNFRRGQKTFNFLMSEMGKEKGFEKASHQGDSLAICLGDLLLFWAGRVFTDALLSFADDNGSNIEKCQQLNEFFYHEMELTGWGQIDDVCLGARKDQVSTDLIYHVYSLKSGHYSVVNPLLLGAMVAGVDENTLKQLEDLAVDLGIIFQIRDDRMNLFGDAQKIGKPIGSDIKENKKTIYRSLLIKNSNQEDKKELLKTFGSEEAGEREVELVRNMINKYQVDLEVEQIMSDLVSKIEARLPTLELNPERNQLLSSLVGLMTSRNK